MVMKRALQVSLIVMATVCAIVALASSAEACDRCQVAVSGVVVCDRAEQTIVIRVCDRCHLRHSLCRCVSRVVGVGSAAVGTVYDTGATVVRVAVSVPIEIGGLAHRTAHRLDSALFEGRRRSHRYYD